METGLARKLNKLLQAWHWAHQNFCRGSALELTTAAWRSRADPLHVVHRPPPTICARRYTVILSITRSRSTVRFQISAEGPRWVATAAIKGWSDCCCMSVYLPIRDSPQSVVTDHPFHRCIWSACRNKNGPIYSTDLGLQAIFICLVTVNLDLPCTSHRLWNRPGRQVELEAIPGERYTKSSSCHAQAWSDMLCPLVGT